MMPRVRLDRVPRVMFGALLVGASPACVSFDYTRVSLNEPVKPVIAQELAHRRSELQECLDVLGAPLELWETPDGFAAAYGWIDEGDWSLTVSISIRAVPLRFDYASENRDLRGIVLLFDQENRVLQARSGYLREITTDLRKRPPQPVPEE